MDELQDIIKTTNHVQWSLACICYLVPVYSGIIYLSNLGVADDSYLGRHKSTTIRSMGQMG
jgi:hypothetical protein